MNKFGLIFFFCFCYTLVKAQTQKPFLAKVNECFSKNELTSAGINLGTQIGDIITLKLTEEEFSSIENNLGIDYIQEARPVKPFIKRTLVDTKADSVHKGKDLKTGYSGKDVIIGITDWGFNYNHPNFYDTALQETRILAAWDQFKISGPAPRQYGYGTEYEGASEILNAEKDTYNIYEWATHGTHVAGIAGGSGAGLGLKGVAYDANFLMVTFQANEASVLEGIEWMHEKSMEYGKRLVINMSWGLYNMPSIDGTSLLSQALNKLSSEGVIFVTSGGNNGDVNFHIEKLFNNDTLRSQVDFYPFSAHPKMYGQRISVWGERGKEFEIQMEVMDVQFNTLFKSPIYSSSATAYIPKAIWHLGPDTVEYQFLKQSIAGLSNQPNAHLIVKNPSEKYRIVLKAWAKEGKVHCYNVTELTNNVGNWGMPFLASRSNWSGGDKQYGLGEPASTESVITVAAHSPKVVFNNGNIIYGNIANFSSVGPTIDERPKPDISAPGVQVESSISAFTNRPYDQTNSVLYKATFYPFARYSGTSMSSPAVAGVAALMLEANPSLTSQQVKDIIIETAQNDDKTGNLKDSHSAEWGWGKGDALRAVKKAESLKKLTLQDTGEANFTLFPNPAKRMIYVMGEKDSVYSCSIFNTLGEVVLNGKIGRITPLSISSLKSGLYFVRLKEGELVKKLMVR